MKKIILQISVVLALAFSISAQENEPQLIDEFGAMPIDPLRAMISEYAHEINKTPNSRLLVRIYGAMKDEDFALAYVRGSIIKGIWNNFVKFDPERLLIQFCNVNKERYWNRFYIVRENDKVESCDENLSVPKVSFLFETAYFDTTYFVPPKIDFNAIESTYPAVEGTPGEYSEFAQTVLKKFLKDSPGSKVYIIVYLNTNFQTDDEGKVVSGKLSDLDKKSKARKMIQAARGELLKNAFSASQFVFINGGYVNNGRRLEFWFVPEGGAIPKPKTDYVPKRRK